MARAQNATPNNLPAPLTNFIGREHEIGEVRRLLSGTRLLTLTGAGGCGKSRLALEAAARSVNKFPDGVWLVQLAALFDPSLVPHAAASALALPEQSGRTATDVLGDHLRSKSPLLILDNCEHLLAACADLSDALLRRCPGLRILTSSREALGVPGETIWRVPSLSTPDAPHSLAADHVAQHEAVRLFLDRAASVRPGFGITAGNAVSVAQICARLDGMPLAIELAAARVKALTPDQIAARLNDRFRLLTGGSRTTLPRQRTLRAAMDWSYDLLTEREQILLARLSVFAGGWTVDAAEIVCAGSGIDAPEVLDLLTSLVDKSLVLTEFYGGAARYGLLETVRQYGREKLHHSGTADSFRGRHRDWCLELAERADPALRGPEQAVWLQRLEAEHDNLRAALEWCTIDEGSAEAGAQLAWALTRFWLLRGYVREGRDWLEKITSRDGAVPALVRARVLCGAGALAEKLGNYDHAQARLEQSLEMFRQLDDTYGTAFALHHLAHIARVRDDFVVAARMFQDSLTLFRETGDKWGCAFTLDCWAGVAIRQGDYDRAASLYEESVALFREIGDTLEVPGPLSGLGLATAVRGDAVRAIALLEESLALARELGGSASIASSLLRLGRVAFRQGDYARAAASFKESMTERKKRGDKDGIAACLTALAGVAVAARRSEHAATLLGAAEALRDSIHTSVPLAQRIEYEAHIAALRADVNETTLAETWARGRALGLDGAIESALALEVSTLPAKSTVSPAPYERSGALTAREREVASLIAQGLSNREIASRLVVAERTAEGHVQSILNKLGFNSRAQIAAWAVTHGVHAITLE